MSARKLRTTLFVAAAPVAAVLIAAAVFDPKVAAAGWLVGFSFWTQVLVGSLTLLMIHRLTGGRWGEIIAPVVEAASAAVPLLIVLALPVFIASQGLYPWSARPAAIKPDVLSLYLNEPWFIARTMLALIGWTALSLVLPHTLARRGQLVAALGLVFHALVISSVSIDWYLSLEAPFTSSSFGASVAVASLVAALAWSAALAPAADGDPAVGDVGGLLLATILGLTYIDFMAVLVIWYGDLPREETWFVERGQLPWSVLAVAAFVLASLLPVLGLIQGRVRNARRPLRVIGGCVLVGLAAYDAYLILPAFGALSLATALLSLIGIGLVLVAVMLRGQFRIVPPAEVANVR